MGQAVMISLSEAELRTLLLVGNRLHAAYHDGVLPYDQEDTVELLLEIIRPKIAIAERMHRGC